MPFHAGKLRSRRGDELVVARFTRVLGVSTPSRSDRCRWAPSLQEGDFLAACKLRLPFHHMVGEFGKEPRGFAHWRQGLLGFLHLPMGVATGLIEAQKFGERYFVV